MVKLSVNETKWSSLLARTRDRILYILIWKFDFGPEKLPRTFEKRAPGPGCLLECSRDGCVVEELTPIFLFQGNSPCYSYSTSSSSALFSQIVGGVDKSKKKSPRYPVYNTKFSTKAHIPTPVHGCHSLRADETKPWLVIQSLVSSVRRLWLPLPGDMVTRMRKVLAIPRRLLSWYREQGWNWYWPFVQPPSPLKLGRA